MGTGVGNSEADLKALMLASLDGDAPAYRALLGMMSCRLRAYFERRLSRDAGEVDDLVQETLIAIHTRRGTYDRTQVFTAWTYAIARYKLVDHFRRKGRRETIPLNDGLLLFTRDESVDVDARNDLERALQVLSPATQALIRDIKLRELSNAEAATARGISETAVKVALHRGLKKLRAHVSRKSDLG